MEKQSTNHKFSLTLVIFGLTGRIARVVENMYFNVFIYKIFHASAETISAPQGHFRQLWLSGLCRR